MTTGSIVLSITFLLLFVQYIDGKTTVFDITKYGAKPDGETDSTDAFLKAWNDAVSSPTPSTLLIPEGEFATNVLRIEGHNKAPLNFKIIGTLKAPAKLADMHGSDGWITMNYVDRMTMSGGGVFDGQGADGWDKNDCAKNPKCPTLPINIRFNFVTNSIVKRVTSKDSKNFHINVLGCKNLTFDHFTISTPKSSINTDGIHLGHSQNIKILNSHIYSGDDCISIGDGTVQLHVENVKCGPGHGFSIGSLGRNVGEADITGVTFKNCTLTGTQNGVRIKTWPSSPHNYSCTVSDVHFEDIIMKKVDNPVIIDQQYCPFNLCDKKNPSLVKISGIIIKNIRGTFTSQEAVQFFCSSKYPCDKIEIGDINLRHVGTNKTIVSACSNVKPVLTGKQTPAICTSAPQSS